MYGYRRNGSQRMRRNNIPRVFRMLTDVHQRIRAHVGLRPAETGGALGGSRQDGVVRHFAFDHTGSRSAITYSPDIAVLNKLFKEEWNPRDINLLGFVHSHPRGVTRPSGGDIFYAERILAAIPELEHLLLPIVMTASDTGSFSIHPWTAVRTHRGVECLPLELSLIGGSAADVWVQRPVVHSPQIRVARDQAIEQPTPMERPKPAPLEPRPADPTAPTVRDRTFDRVGGVYDLSRLKRSRIICVGTGGAASYIEELARCGVGQFVLIDPDIVTETNIATQAVYRKDLGRPKVVCLKERILDIHPGAQVVTRQRRLEELGDDDFSAILHADLGQGPPKVSVLCGLTDSFPAQARVNRLALQFGVPSLNAQVYAQGKGAEVTFTYPGVTPACHRCVLGSRYRAYLDDNFRNDVTSDGTPIFATSRLNSLKGYVTLALLHHGTDHDRWGGTLERIGKRNLLLIRMDPDLQLKPIDRALEGADGERMFFDETVWLPQDPECPATGFDECPECHATGDLRDAVGSFDDTRPMPALPAPPDADEGVGVGVDTVA